MAGTPFVARYDTTSKTPSTPKSAVFEPEFTYTFENFFHPFVGELIAKLNRSR